MACSTPSSTRTGVGGAVSGFARGLPPAPEGPAAGRWGGGGGGGAAPVAPLRAGKEARQPGPQHGLLDPQQPPQGGGWRSLGLGRRLAPRWRAPRSRTVGWWKGDVPRLGPPPPPYVRAQRRFQFLW